MANLTSAAIFIQCFFSLACDLKFQETTTVVIDEQVRQLTTDSRLKEHPAWSPDGSMIAYSYQGTVTTLTARALTGEELEILGRVEDDLRNARFDFSPDGAERYHLWR